MFFGNSYTRNNYKNHVGYNNLEKLVGHTMGYMYCDILII